MKKQQTQSLTKTANQLPEDSYPPTITHGQKTFNHISCLGKGAFGVVHLYEQNKSESEPVKMAVKIENSNAQLRTNSITKEAYYLKIINKNSNS